MQCVFVIVSDCTLYRAIRPFWAARTFAWLLANSVTGPLASYLLGFVYSIQGQNYAGHFCCMKFDTVLVLLYVCLYVYVSVSVYIE